MDKDFPEGFNSRLEFVEHLLKESEAREQMANAWLDALIPAIDRVFDVFDPESEMAMEQFNALLALSKARHEGVLPERERKNGNSRSNQTDS